MRYFAAPYAFEVGSTEHMQDPEGSGVIINAVSWLQGTLMGTVATTVAVIAVAVVGFMMLTGRINWRHGAVGCCQSNCTLTSERYVSEAVSLALVAGPVPGLEAFGQHPTSRETKMTSLAGSVQLL